MIYFCTIIQNYKIIQIIIEFCYSENFTKMDQLLPELDKTIVNMVEYSVNNYTIYYDSLESYYSRKVPSFKRKILFYLTFVLFAVFNVKYGLLLMYPNKMMWTPMKDWTMVLGNQAVLVHALLFSISLVALTAKLVVVYYEAKSELKILDIFAAIISRDQSYMLNQKHFKKIKFGTSFFYYIFVRIFGFIVVVVFTFCITGLTIVVYLYYDYGNVITLWLWTVLMIFIINQIKVVVLLGTILFYLPITLIKYKFDELIDKLRVCIRWNNENGFYKTLESYDQLIVVVKQLSGPYNMIIGIIYCFGPYLIAINIEVLKIKRDDWLFKILEQAFLLLLIITNLDAFIINQISASISVSNKSFPKCLYPVFCWKRKKRITMELKIDSFIARLNEQFVGFYCFNWFKFTKMAFYE